ncbi:MAG: hypothetical protein JWN46_555 [Acidimicrobiales bacterium]|nr:hypothetical protein [Acidimicrobiales bacterium]
MHPIERLRYVARASGADPDELVREVAGSLAAFAGEPAALVTACRRMVDRHPAVAPVWWLCARVLSAGDPGDEAWRALDELHRDPTVRELANALPADATVCVLGWPERLGEALSRRGDVEVLVVDTLDEGSGFVRLLARRDVGATDVPLAGLGAAAAAADLVLFDLLACGPTEALAVAGSRAAAAVACTVGRPVWGVAGVGRLVPARLWDAITARVELPAEPWELDEDRVPLDLVSHLVGPRGLEPTAEAVRHIDCPAAPELLRQV